MLPQGCRLAFMIVVSMPLFLDKCWFHYNYLLSLHSWICAVRQFWQIYFNQNTRLKTKSRAVISWFLMWNIPLIEGKFIVPCEIYCGIRKKRRIFEMPLRKVTYLKLFWKTQKIASWWFLQVVLFSFTFYVPNNIASCSKSGHFSFMAEKSRIIQLKIRTNSWKEKNKHGGARKWQFQWSMLFGLHKIWKKSTLL